MKLAAREKRQDFMKRFNAAMRKRKKDGGAALKASAEKFNLKPETVAQLLQPDSAGRPGFASYPLTHNNAQIRRLKARIEQLKAPAHDETTEEQIGAVRIVENTEENRLQLFFPGQPSASFRRQLKRSGFRWARSQGAVAAPPLPRRDLLGPRARRAVRQGGNCSMRPKPCPWNPTFGDPLPVPIPEGRDRCARCGRVRDSGDLPGPWRKPREPGDFAPAIKRPRRSPAKRRAGKPAPRRLDVLTIPPAFELEWSYWIAFGRPAARKDKVA